MVCEQNVLCWQAELLKQVIHNVEADNYWRGRFSCRQDFAEPLFAVHLAVFIEPYLGFLLDGTKTIESRFSRKSCPPYNCLRSGDAILLKRSGGAVTGICQVGSVWDYRLGPESWSDIRRHACALCVSSPEFWQERAEASYATLMRVEHVLSISPITCQKRDRRGWVVLRPKIVQLELEETQ